MSEFLLSGLLNGLAVGSIYALIALGFALLYKSTKILNLAHGELVLFGGYLAIALTRGPLPGGRGAHAAGRRGVGIHGRTGDHAAAVRPAPAVRDHCHAGAGVCRARPDGGYLGWEHSKFPAGPPRRDRARGRHPDSDRWRV